MLLPYLPPSVTWHLVQAQGSLAFQGLVSSLSMTSPGPQLPVTHTTGLGPAWLPVSQASCPQQRTGAVGRESACSASISLCSSYNIPRNTRHTQLSEPLSFLPLPRDTFSRRFWWLWYRTPLSPGSVHCHLLRVPPHKPASAQPLDPSFTWHFLPPNTVSIYLLGYYSGWNTASTRSRNLTTNDYLINKH